jgi:hypothetical protein
LRYSPCRGAGGGSAVCEHGAAAAAVAYQMAETPPAVSRSRKSRKRVRTLLNWVMGL